MTTRILTQLLLPFARDVLAMVGLYEVVIKTYPTLATWWLIGGAVQ